MGLSAVSVEASLTVPRDVVVSSVTRKTAVFCVPVGSGIPNVEGRSSRSGQSVGNLSRSALAVGERLVRYLLGIFSQPVGLDKIPGGFEGRRTNDVSAGICKGALLLC